MGTQIKLTAVQLLSNYDVPVVQSRYKCRKCEKNIYAAIYAACLCIVKI